MSRRSPWCWAVLLVWNVWICALSGRLAAAPLLGWIGGPWVPDLGLVLLLGLEPGLRPGSARLAAVLAALSRAAFTADPILALLAGYLGAVGLARALRTVVETDHPLSRAWITGGAAALLALFWAAARHARLEAAAWDVPLQGSAAWRIGVSTFLASLVLLPLLLRLPGLSPLQGRTA